MPDLPQISEAEFEVMKIIWKYAPINTNEITERLLKTTAWSPKTIQTLIKRLVTKGALTYEKQGRVFVYTPLVGQNEYVSQESSAFLNRFYNGNISAMLSSYLEKYPSGKMVTNAEYYLAECYRLSSQPETACDHYARVMAAGKGPFLEQAAMNYAELSYSMQKFREAFDAYSGLYSSTKVAEYRTASLVGLMRSAYRARLYDDAVRYSEIVARQDFADEDLVREARYVDAKSLLATSRRDEAFAVLAVLAEEPATAEGAEASYLMIQDSYDRGAFDEVETRVYGFSESGTAQNYWLAKSFIVLGDAFVDMENLEQAKATFESVAQGYTPETEDDDVLPGVRMRLEKLQELMQTGSIE